MSNELSTEVRDGTLIVQFTRPEIRNPLSTSVLDRLYKVLNETRSGRIIFTGSAESFASGADLREIAMMTPESAMSFAEYGQQLMTKVSQLPQLTIAAINGYCFGGALDLALACNVRIASPDAKFAHPGTGLGIITGWGGTQRLPRLVGRANALEMFFSASPIDAEHAARIGLIDSIAEDVLNAALSRRASTNAHSIL